ncbi:PKD domain-containing protein [Streptomyces sp. NBC_00320]|uniref:PKD domain-containing protein n=1 Tax=unclassified Streptomyces TaxID=2593676 RepID=UPI00225166FC|nr:PKD domain-containing protein [Streptomyces sp. NBC_00320]MCX5146440.1 PKD domain-containing protein [Streptomyces sp. NBC_00320]
MAAGVGLVSGTAHAADPVAPATRAVSAPTVDLGKAKAANAQTFSSAADRTVRTPLPAGKGKSAAAQARAAEGNPDLGIHLNASAHSAHGLDLVTDITSGAAPLTVTVDWGDGTKAEAQASGSTQLKHSHAYAELGDYKVTVTVVDTANQVQAANDVLIRTVGSDFVAHAPTRLLDTRSGTGAARAKVGGRSSAQVKIKGVAGIPDENITAVALNVTVTNTVEAGHITAYPKGGAVPTTSNLNYEAGQSVPNMVIVPVSTDGYVELFNGGWAPVDLIADVTGYFTRSSAAGYTSLAPSRFVDTREGLGTSKGQVSGYGSFGVQIADRGSVPKGATAVALNVTVTNPQEAGHVTVFPSGQSAPTTSSVNFGAGQTIANSVIVPVGADGKISIRNGSWKGTDVIVDVVGYYSPDSKAAYMPLTPHRWLDTRLIEWKGGPVPSRGYMHMAISPDEQGIEGYVLNTTVTNTVSPGFLSVAPDPNTLDQYKNGTAVWPERPVSSVLNWTAFKTVPNLVQASSGEHGVIDLWNQSYNNVDLIVDMFGYYESK